MAEVDIRVLSNRRLFIAASVHLDEELLKKMIHHQLLGNDLAKAVLALETPTEKWESVITHFLDSETFSMAAFCHSIREEYPHIVDELHVDVRAEVGALEIEEHMRRQAATMVHKRFGTTRRFSERDKRQIAIMIAYKSQVAKETSNRQVKELAVEVEKLRNKCKNMENRLMQLHLTLKTFVKQNHLENTLCDMRSTSDALRHLRKKDSHKDTFDQLDKMALLMMNKMTWMIHSEKTTNPVDRYAHKVREEFPCGGDTESAQLVPVRPLIIKQTTKRTSTSEQRPRFPLNMSGLKRKIVFLEDELTQKDDEIESLKAEICRQDQVINSLQSILSSRSRTSSSEEKSSSGSLGSASSSQLTLRQHHASGGKKIVPERVVTSASSCGCVESGLGDVVLPPMMKMSSLTAVIIRPDTPEPRRVCCEASSIASHEP